MLAETIAIRQNPIAGYERYGHTLVHARGDIQNYQDDDRAMGGFWSSSFKTWLNSDNQTYDFFENGLGREIKAYGYGSRVLHEGMVYEMQLNVPPDRFTITLDGMFNEMLMRADYDADGATERSTTKTDADSQARWGSKVRVFGGGQLNSLSVADQAVETALGWAAFPKPSVSRGRGRGEPYLEIFSRGYIYMLAWEIYNQTADTSTEGMSARWQTIAETSQYVESVKYSTNATVVSKVTDADRKILDLLNDLTRLGDSDFRRWLMYMTEGRVLHLTPAPPATVVI